MPAMDPGWSFSRLHTVSSPSREPLGMPNSSSPISGVITSQASTEPQITTIGTPSRTYSRLHLLGLPHEIRDQIWQVVFDDLTYNPRSKWSSRPSTQYDGLLLTSRQVWHETTYFWPRTIIQHKRVTTFIQLHKLGDFQRLTLEIPHEYSRGFYNTAARALSELGPALQDLRIFFVGKDDHGIQTLLHGCGYHETDIASASKKLTIDGQRHIERQPLFLALRYLSELRSLVLSNSNYPLIQSLLIAGHRHLRNLHIGTDPRSTLHKELDLNHVRYLIMPPVNNFPPVTNLNLSANAALTSLQVASKCAATLRHLTWIVPDPSRQSGNMSIDWYADTAILLHNLRRNAQNLKIFRICIEGPIYEADEASGALMGGFHHHFEHLTIDTFEIHINCQSPWFGREIMRYLPNTVRSVYLSRELLDEALLEDDVTYRYLSCYLKPGTDYRSPPNRTIGSRPEKIPVLDTYCESCERTGPDSRGRKDFISMSGGSLGFVSYEYDPRIPTRFGNSEVRMAFSKETKGTMMKVNGQLLDRERNAHLALYDGGHFIPFKQKTITNVKTGDSLTGQDNKSLTSINKTKFVDEVGEHAAFFGARKADFDESEMNKHWYFGMEKKAQHIFDNEIAVNADDLPALHWPDEVEASRHDHWGTEFVAPRWEEEYADVDAEDLEEIKPVDVEALETMAGGIIRWRQQALGSGTGADASAWAPELKETMSERCGTVRLVQLGLGPGNSNRGGKGGGN